MAPSRTRPSSASSRKPSHPVHPDDACMTPTESFLLKQLDAFRDRLKGNGSEDAVAKAVRDYTRLVPLMQKALSEEAELRGWMRLRAQQAVVFITTYQPRTHTSALSALPAISVPNYRTPHPSNRPHPGTRPKPTLVPVQFHPLAPLGPSSANTPTSVSPTAVLPQYHRPPPIPVPPPLEVVAQPARLVIHDPGFLWISQVLRHAFFHPQDKEATGRMLKATLGALKARERVVEGGGISPATWSEIMALIKFADRDSAPLIYPREGPGMDVRRI